MLRKTLAYNMPGISISAVNCAEPRNFAGPSTRAKSCPRLLIEISSVRKGGAVTLVRDALIQCAPHQHLHKLPFIVRRAA